MRPGLEEMFRDETADLFNKKIAYVHRRNQWTTLIERQGACVRGYEDGSIASPINPEDVEDAKEYLERLKALQIPL